METQNNFQRIKAFCRHPRKIPPMTVFQYLTMMSSFNCRAILGLKFVHMSYHLDLRLQNWFFAKQSAARKSKPQAMLTIEGFNQKIPSQQKTFT